MRKSAAATAAEKGEAAKVAGKVIKQDQQAKCGTTPRIHRQQSKDADEDDDGPTPGRPRRMLSEAQVLALVPLSRTSIWRLQRAGKFPPCTYISPNKRIWFEDTIIKWQCEVNQFNPHRRRGPGRKRRAAEQAEA